MIPILPASQFKQLALPSSDFSPTPQSLQEDDPGDFENVLAAQSTHSVLPAAVLNLPGTQGKHAADATSGWYLPAGQSRPLYVLYRVSKRKIMKKVRKVKKFIVFYSCNFFCLHFVNSVFVIMSFTLI